MSFTVGTGWTIDLDDEVGHGGFGRVVAAARSGSGPAVAKLVPKAPGADRELLAADLPQSQHLVAVLEIAETDDCWIVIMPRATQSLRDRVDSTIPLELNEALAILGAIAEGLTDLVKASPAVVHRDLKPENVLLLNGSWAICDFGIARYAAATTAPDTHKYAMTAAYAAPEQWKQERATVATDVYAFGIIAYELCTGARPFGGPDRESFRQQHLEVTPARAAALPSRLQSILVECLHKAPGARPPAGNLVVRLASAGQDLQKPGASALAEAQRIAVEQQGEQLRQAEAARTETERRAALFEAARATLQLLTQELVDAITDAAPAARVTKGAEKQVIRLGGGALEVATPVGFDDPAMADAGIQLDVIGATTIRVTQAEDTYQRGHSLWYCNWNDPEQYAWYELAFMTQGFSRQTRASEPFDLPPRDEAAGALSTTLTMTQGARPALAVRPAEADDFIDRWSGYLAKASQGTLTRPIMLPEGTLNYPRRDGRWS